MKRLLVLLLAFAAGGLARAAEPADPMRANTILREPFPGDDFLAPTLVTVDMKGLDAEAAFEKFAESTGMRIAIAKTPAFTRQPPPPITLALEKQPLLEALLRFRAQGSFTITTGAEGPRANYNPNRQLPGAWCVSGPFAFAITAINHSVMMDREGKIAQPSIYGEGESLIVSMTSFAEPKLGVLQYPGMVTLKEVTDENRHSLIPDPAAPKPGFARAQQPLATRPEFSIALSYPKAEAGRRIKTFKGTAEFLIQGQTHPLVLENPLAAEPAEFSLAGMTITVGRMTWNGETRRLEQPVTFQRGNADPSLWATLPLALAAVPPKVETSDGRLISERSPRVMASGNTISLTCTFFAGLPVETAINAPAVKRVTILVPTGSKQVTVPVEFHDLPLP